MEFINFIRKKKTNMYIEYLILLSSKMIYYQSAAWKYQIQQKRKNLLMPYRHFLNSLHSDAEKSRNYIYKKESLTSHDIDL